MKCMKIICTPTLRISKHIAMITLLVVAPLLSTVPVHAASHYHEVGIATSATLLHMNDRDLNARLHDIISLGATWIRVDFSWAAIQPNGPHDYRWTMYDRVVQAATARHLKVLAVLGYTPPWARDSRCASAVRDENEATKCSPRSAQEFGHFAAMASFRYRHQSIRAWEIWNEPNLSG